MTVTTTEAFTAIVANWPSIKESLEAKKAVDAAFATSDLHRANARAARKEFEEFVEKTQGVKAIFKFNKKSTQRELLSIVERERNAALESESKAVEMSQKFQSNRPSFDILESNISIILASQHTTTTKHLFTTLATSRSLYDAARSQLFNHIAARTLLVQSRKEADATRTQLITEYSGDGYESAYGETFVNYLYLDKGDSYIDPKTQQNAIYTSAVVTENIQRAFNLVPDIPPHVTKRQTMDPDGPAAKGRKRTAIVIQNAVYRLDDLVDNLDASLVYVDEKLEELRETVEREGGRVRECAGAIWGGAVENVQVEGVEEVGKWIGEMSLMVRAFNDDRL